MSTIQPIPPLPIELEIPIDKRPMIDGVGEMQPELYSFNKLGIYPLNIYDETTQTETVGHLIVAYVKAKGLILCCIPFYYRFGSLREHSASIFRFKAGPTLTAFQAWVAYIISNF